MSEQQRNIINFFMHCKFFIKMESRAETAMILEIYSITRKLILDLQTGTIRKKQLYLLIAAYCFVCDFDVAIV